MAEEYDWTDLESAFVTTLRETRVEPVPDAIVKLAQASLDGQAHPDNPDQIMHAMQREFPTVEMAAAFAKHMRNAGPHTTPASSVTVIVDPERKKVAKVDTEGKPVLNDNGKPVMEPGEPVNPKKVAWRAGERRGRKNN